MQSFAEMELVRGELGSWESQVGYIQMELEAGAGQNEKHVLDEHWWEKCMGSLHIGAQAVQSLSKRENGI